MTAETSSLGEFLRHERERRGITIEQVASATKIGVRTLHSLESDHYAELPAKPFIRGFVISYCRFIGLDAKEVLASYTDFMLLKATERPNREGGHSGYAFEKRDGEQQSRTLLFIAIFGFIIIGGVAVLLLKPSFHHHKNSHIDKLKAAHGSTSEKAADKPADKPADLESATDPVQVAKGTDAKNLTATHSGLVSGSLDASGATLAQAVSNPQGPITLTSVPSPSALPSTTPSSSPTAEAEAVQPKVAAASEGEKPGADPEDPLDSGHKLKAEDAHHRILFKIKEDIWVRYQVDGRPARKFVIRGGKSLILRAKDKITFQVANPELISYSYNNRPFTQVNESKNTIKKQGETTLFFPWDAADKSHPPFKDTRPLPKVVNIKPEESQPQAAPSP